jgi:hypothetical protein
LWKIEGDCNGDQALVSILGQVGQLTLLALPSPLVWLFRIDRCQLCLNILDKPEKATLPKNRA